MEADANFSDKKNSLLPAAAAAATALSLKQPFYKRGNYTILAEQAVMAVYRKSAYLCATSQALLATRLSYLPK